jgi:DNA-binding NarL/FixJ family response regulator
LIGIAYIAGRLGGTLNEMPKGTKSPRGKPPRSLIVERLSVDGEELLVFEWTTDAPAVQPLPELSRAEQDVLERVVRGDSNAAIARARKTSVRTVANQVASLLRKTGAASRFELINRFGGRGGQEA